MAFTLGQLRDIVLKNVFNSKETADDTLIEHTFVRRRWNLLKHPADAAASTALEVPFEVTDIRYEITSVTIHPAAALTGDGTNNATITLEYDDGAGGANTVVATITTTANWTAQTPVDVPITAANKIVAAGKQLILKIAKGGTGVACPSFTFTVKALPV